MFFEAASRICTAAPELAMGIAYRALSAKPRMLWSLIYMRLNRKVEIQQDLVKKPDDASIAVADWPGVP